MNINELMTTLEKAVIGTEKEGCDLKFVGENSDRSFVLYTGIGKFGLKKYITVKITEKQDFYKILDRKENSIINVSKNTYDELAQSNETVLHGGSERSRYAILSEPFYGEMEVEAEKARRQRKAKRKKEKIQKLLSNLSPDERDILLAELLKH